MWSKCNVGFSFCKGNQLVGASWVLRDDKGRMLLHSRRCFAGNQSIEEAKLQVLLWAIECMVFHKVTNVLFASEFQNLVGVINRSKAWSSFDYQTKVLLSGLEIISSWQMIVETQETNKGASLIATSVTKDHRIQS